MSSSICQYSRSFCNRIRIKYRTNSLHCSSGKLQLLHHTEPDADSGWRYSSQDWPGAPERTCHCWGEEGQFCRYPEWNWRSASSFRINITFQLWNEYNEDHYFSTLNTWEYQRLTQAASRSSPFGINNHHTCQKSTREAPRGKSRHTSREFHPISWPSLVFQVGCSDKY